MLQLPRPQNGLVIKVSACVAQNSWTFFNKARFTRWCKAIKMIHDPPPPPASRLASTRLTTPNNERFDHTTLQQLRFWWGQRQQQRTSATRTPDDESFYKFPERFWWFQKKNLNTEREPNGSAKGRFQSLAEYGSGLRFDLCPVTLVLCKQTKHQNKKII